MQKLFTFLDFERWWDGALVHFVVTPIILSLVAIYTPGGRQDNVEQSVLSKETTVAKFGQRSGRDRAEIGQRPGSNHRPRDPKINGRSLNHHAWPNDDEKRKNTYLFKNLCKKVITWPVLNIAHVLNFRCKLTENEDVRLKRIVWEKYCTLWQKKNRWF